MTWTTERGPLPVGLTYDAYRAAWEAKLELPLRGLDREARRYLFYARYNHARAARVQAAYELSEKVRQELQTLPALQRWVVLTEDWCVDSAFVMPVVAAFVEASPHLELRILPRDAHLDVMDRYLTRGARSIPKLVAFAEDGRELFSWGPRPASIQALRERLLEEGADGPSVSAAVLEAYEAGAWQEVDNELAALVAANRMPLRRAG